MKLTKNEALLVLSNKLMDQRIKPMLDTMIQYRLDNPKPIKYNKALDNDDYALWKARQENKAIVMNKGER